jgi:hypothetical protein
VLLDGGPTRAFTAADGELLEEDLTILKVRLGSYCEALERALAHMY